MSRPRSYTVTICNLTKEQAAELKKFWNTLKMLPGEIYIGDPAKSLDIRTNQHTRKLARERLKDMFYKKYPHFASSQKASQ